MKRYIESAEIEVEIIEHIQGKAKGNPSSDLFVKYYEKFCFYKNRKEYMAIVFEQLGKSLYEFIKENNYFGMS